MNIIISGSGGFVGTNFINEFIHYYNFHVIKREHKNPRVPNEIFWNEIKSDVLKYPIIHLAGKSQDVNDFNKEKEYYSINTELTKKLFDSFIESDSNVFIFLSSIKAVTDSSNGILTEDDLPDPKSIYGKSKLLAEEYLMSKTLPRDKRLYILRPSLIHGPGNKGNIRLLYKLIAKKYPWPLAAFKNQRSYCSVRNLCFVIRELIEREDIPSGIYNIADDKSLSTNEIIELIGKSLKITPFLIKIPISVVKLLARFGDILGLSFNSVKLNKMIDYSVVSNEKIKKALGKDLPLTAHQGFEITFESFYNDTDS